MDQNPLPTPEPGISPPPGPHYYLTGPDAFRQFKEVLGRTPTDEEARRALADFVIKFPDVARWVKWQKTPQELERILEKDATATPMEQCQEWERRMRDLDARLHGRLQRATNVIIQRDVHNFNLHGTVTGRVYSGVPNATEEEPKLRGRTRAELAVMFKEFQREVRMTQRALGLLKKKPVKPTVSWLIRVWRKLTGWKRPAKPGRRTLTETELHRWAARVTRRYLDAPSSTLRCFWGGMIFFNCTPVGDRQSWYCSTFGARSNKHLQYGLRAGPVADTWQEALVEFRQQYPGLFDGTLFSRTYSEAAWWWDRRCGLTPQGDQKLMFGPEGESFWWQIVDDGYWAVFKGNR